MASVQDKINTIENGGNYVANSLIIKSFDERGCVLKWLEDNAGNADRKQCFIELTASEKHLAVTKRTAVSDININNPQ